MPCRGSPRYTTVEISAFAGRSVEAKKRRFRLLFERARNELGLDPADLEITIEGSGAAWR